jgi:hypothetical protein
MTKDTLTQLVLDHSRPGPGHGLSEILLRMPYDTQPRLFYVPSDVLEQARANSAASQASAKQHRGCRMNRRTRNALRDWLTGVAVAVALLFLAGSLTEAHAASDTMDSRVRGNDDAGGNDTEMFGPCLIGTTVEHLPHGAKRVRWSRPDTLECKLQDPAMQTYMQSAAADAASTALALTRDGLFEANPLGLGGGAALKLLGAVVLANTEPSPERTRWANKGGALQWGLTANNLCLFAGTAAPLCHLLGAAVVAHQWPLEGH